MALECPPSEPHALVSHVAHGRAPIGRPTALDGTRLSRGQMVRVEAAPRQCSSAWLPYEPLDPAAGLTSSSS